jgi:ABC-2 type transport system ATP-binding protein
MIEVERLTKRFGSILAVDRIGFAVGRGEIVGLLGPNGAGKTTTMRMLTTYVAPTSGRAELMGHDVLDQPLEVRRNIGYLPENVPLYLEMRVVEYLKYRAQLKEVPRRRRRRSIAEVMVKCGLGAVENRVLGHLSKGYRQRVGLADAMLHDPPVLILDEPTAGLDPIQIREVRSLIRELGDRHTILLSTHIMSEVEAICGRVIIIARGTIALDERLDRLQTDPAIILEARGSAESIREILRAVPGVERVALLTSDDEYASFEVTTKDGIDLRETLGRRLASNGRPLRHLDLRHNSLEDRFVQAVTRETLTDARPLAETG